MAIFHAGSRDFLTDEVRANAYLLNSRSDMNVLTIFVRQIFNSCRSGDTGYVQRLRDMPEQAIAHDTRVMVEGLELELKYHS
jgi:hypothetical protein